MKDQRGAVLIATVLLMLVFLLFLMSLAHQAATEADMATKYLDRLKAYYTAEAGYARFRTGHAKREAAFLIPFSSPATLTKTESFQGGSYTLNVAAAETIDLTAGNGKRVTRRLHPTSTGSFPTTSPRATRVIEERWVERDVAAFTSTNKAGADGMQALRRDPPGAPACPPGVNMQLGGVWEPTPADPDNEWIYLEFNMPRKVDRFDFLVGASTTTLALYEIHAWDDTAAPGAGVYEPGNWVLLASGGPVTPESCTVSVLFPARITRRIRLKAVSVTTGATRLTVAEIWAFYLGNEVRDEFVLRPPSQFGNMTSTTSLRNDPFINPPQIGPPQYTEK